MQQNPFTEWSPWSLSTKLALSTQTACQKRIYGRNLKWKWSKNCSGLNFSMRALMRSRWKTWVFRGDPKNPDDVNSKESLVNLESFGMMTRIEKTIKGNTWAKTYPSILKAFETRTPRKEKSSPPKLFPYNSQFLFEHKTLKIEHRKRFFFKTSRSAIFQNIEITQSRAVWKISGSVARAS